MILYFTPTACSLASHIALEESGADYEARIAKLWKPDEAAAYRQVNPTGKVPALIVDGRVLTETVAILSYVADAYPDAGLMPEDPWARAQVLSLCAWFASTAHISRRQTRAPERFTPDPVAHEALRAAGQVAVRANLARIDSLLEGRDWLVGERLSVADPYALVFYDWAVRDDIDLTPYAHFTRFKDRMVARPAVRRVLEDERSPLVAAPA